jgi:protein O-mannosyl-transferase
MATKLQALPKSSARRSKKRSRQPVERTILRRSSTRSSLLALVGLTLTTLALYGQIASHDFINLDDEAYVLGNQHVKDGLTWQDIRWAFTSTEQANWHPLTWLSHELDCQLYGLAPAGHHITSLVFHLFNVLLLFWLLRKVTGWVGRSFLVAALFAIHPLNVESVAWIAERKNVLSTFFFLLTLAAYGWYAEKPNWKRYVPVAVFFALGLAAKPMMVTLPFVLLLIDYWPLQRISDWQDPPEVFPAEQRSAKSLLIEKLPLLLVSAVSSVVTVMAQKAGGAIASLVNIPYHARFENALCSYFLYIWKMLWPSGLAAYYPNPFDPAYGPSRGEGMLGAAILSGLFLATISFFIWRLRRTHPYLATGWLWYLGTLVPVIGIVQVGTQSMADRYSYVPLIGLFIALAWGSADLAQHWGLGEIMRQIAAAAVLTALVLVTFRQIGFWQNTFTLWPHAIEVTTDNFVANDLMASAYMEAHNPRSLHYYQEAARLAPWDAISHGFVAASLQDQGRLREAIPEYEIVVENPPNVNRECFAYLNLGIIYSELGDYAKAKIAFDRANRKSREAISDMIDTLGKAVAARPTDEGYIRLGLLFQHAGRSAEAKNAFEQALRMNPNRQEARNFLGSAP